MAAVRAVLVVGFALASKMAGQGDFVGQYPSAPTEDASHWGQLLVVGKRTFWNRFDAE